MNMSDKPTKIREHGRGDLTDADRASGVAREARYFAISPVGNLVSLEDHFPMPLGFRLAQREDLELALERAHEADGGDRAGYLAVRDALLTLGWKPPAPTDVHPEAAPAPLPPPEEPHHAA
jgi:hypothetical protein